MKKKSIIISIVSVIVIAILAVILLKGGKADNNKDNTDTPNASTSENIQADPSEEGTDKTQSNVTTQSEQTEQSTQDADKTQKNETTKPEQSRPNNKPVANQKETVAQGKMSKKEIVALYNEAVNKVKIDAKKLTRNYRHLSIPEDQLKLPSSIQGIAASAIKTFVKDNNEPESWTSKDDMQLVFPVGGTNYSSKMTADMVKSASCTDNGKTYKIDIKLYDDAITSPKKGQGYAGIFNTTTASTFTDINIPTVTFNKVDVNGVNGSISCTIDKATKRVTKITFSNTDIMKLNVKVAFSTMDVKMAMILEENFTIQY